MAQTVRVRTISGCIAELKLIDPGTQVKQNYVRNLVLTGAVKSTRAGAKYLVNFESLLDYLQNPPTGPEPDPEQQYGKLRRIN